MQTWISFRSHEIVLVNFQQKKLKFLKIYPTLAIHRDDNEQFIYLERLVLFLFLYKR